MAKQKKSTKKFEKKHLQGVLGHRNEVAKGKQRHRFREKKKKDREARERLEEGHSHTRGSESAAEGEKDNPNKDEYFQETIQIPELDSKNKPKNGNKRKRPDSPEAIEAADETSEGSDEEGENYQNQLNALADKDPEFYKYLRENDAELLDFDEDVDLEEVEDVDDLSEDDKTPPTKKRKTTDRADRDEDAGAEIVTMETIKKWKASMTEQYSIRSLRQIILAFRAAADTTHERQDQYKYSIPNSEVYHEVLTTALQQVPIVLAHHLPVKETAAGKLRVPTDGPKFKTLSPLIKSHVSSIHYLMNQLSDAATLKIVLQSFQPLLPYLLQFRKFLKVVIKSVTSVWSDRTSDEATRITAFLLLRKLMVIGDPGIREAVLKSGYEGVVKGSRNTTIHSLPAINLMKNSAADLWGIDQKIGYTSGFTFIRQLAIHLRGNITKPTKDSYKTIYNWQFIHSLDFWSRVLSTHCNSLLEAQTGKESQLRPLIYPVVQITLGVMRLIPTSAYFPLRFQLMRSLLRISQATGTYIPLSSALLEVLNSSEMKNPAKKAGAASSSNTNTLLRPLDFDSTIRAPTTYLSTRIYQEGVGEQVSELLSEFLVLWCKCIAYPELQLPVMTMLKRWLKQASKGAGGGGVGGAGRGGNKNAKLNQALLLLVHKSEANAKWIEERRNTVRFSPRDRSEVEAFLKDVRWEDTPLGAFVVNQRKQRGERKKVIERGRAVENERRQKTKEQQDDGSNDEEIE